MSKELKFRAWNASFGMSDIFTVFEFPTWGSGNHFAGGGTEIMQYTGLHDKLDNEIYEGDIVVTEQQDESLQMDVWCREDYGAADVKISCYSGVRLDGKSIDWPWDDDESVYSLKHIQIIGNIYEDKYPLEIRNPHDFSSGKYGEESNAWIGDDAGYGARHTWLSRRFTKPTSCEICKRSDVSRIEWANISGQHYRRRSDYMGLCPSCHRWKGGKSRCIHGHEYTPENTYINSRGHRECRLCIRNNRRNRQRGE